MTGLSDCSMSFSWCKIVFVMPSCGRPARAWVLDIHFWGIATLKYFELLAEPNYKFVFDHLYDCLSQHFAFVRVVVCSATTAA